MHGKTKKERDNYYRENMPKAKRMIRYISKIISSDIHATNFQILREVIERQPSFNKVTWEFIDLIRVSVYRHSPEQEIIDTALERGYISKSDLYIRRRNKNA